MSALPTCLKESRCILHIDLDCFFSQVEEVRLGLDPEKPVAVQQWSNLIAVNYAARKYGVTRLSTVEEALALCPDIKLVHVATYAPNETEAKYHENPSKKTHKVSLDSYRIAGKKIFQIFQEHCPILQKVGSDEAFFDVTEMVNQRLCQQYIPTYSYLMDHLDDIFLPKQHSLDWDSVAHTVKSRDENERNNNNSNNNETTIWDPITWMDLQLFIGASIAKYIRKQIYDQLKYTCSAGVANNKILAKLGSSMNKPNKQTIIRQHIAMDFMKDIQLSKIRNLGGKFGNSVEQEYKAEKAGDLWKYSKEELQDKFGLSSGLWLYNIVRGIDNEEVTPHKAPKSLIASKSMYPPITEQRELSPWFSMLSGEIYNRIMTNYHDHQTWPKTLSVTYRCSLHGKYLSKSTSMLHRSELTNIEKLSKKIEKLFTAIEITLPCTYLSVQAGGLISASIISNRSIASFFSSKPNINNNNIMKEDDNISEKHKIEEEDEDEEKKDLTLSSPLINANNDTFTNITSASASKDPTLNFFTRKSNNHTSKDIENINNQPNTSNKSLKRTVSAFFTNESSSSEELSWKCDRCSQKVLIKDIDEHTDFHFAMDLSEQNSQPERKKIKTQQ
ncbi:hypothetical protein BJ944DRAFT_198223 [Cunninghamella echinulata]|nr:hypothetical protein BJ944DRAFT_198223 [Cunninghamella echinulata]